MSEKTGRGPLPRGWIDSPPGDGVLLWAYKLCRIEVVDLPIMKDGVEAFIVDVVRTSLLDAATQAWVWQDEWLGLTIEVCDVLLIIVSTRCSF